MTTDTPDATLELYVRSLAPASENPKQAAVLDRVDRLVEAGTVADCSVYVVGGEVCPETARATEPGRFICERVAQFRAWAERNDLSVAPFVELRRVASELTGEEYETIAFPTTVLAEFEGDRLRAVAPCTDGERPYTVTDLLDALEADDPLTLPRTTGGSPPQREREQEIADGDDSRTEERGGYRGRGGRHHALAGTQRGADWRPGEEDPP